MALYPPEIEGTLPAFYSQNGTVELRVPFKHNTAVQEYDGMYVKIKSIQSGNLIFLVKYEGTNLTTPLRVDITSKIEDYRIDHPYAFQPGSYYGVQIGYYSGDAQPQYYSTLGIAKLTSEPKVSIDFGDSEVSPWENHNPLDKYVAIYTNEDSSEKVYKYKFELSDDDGVIETTDWQLNLESNYDSATQSHNEFTPSIGYEDNKAYYLQYFYQTNNSISSKTQKYKIMSMTTLDSELKAILHAFNNEEEGYIEITLTSKDDSIGNGRFKLERSSGNNEWVTLYRFVLHNEKLENWSYKDFTVEQGVTYQYAIREYGYSNGVQTNRIMLTETENGVEVETSIVADFDHMYLYDGERQLKIKYNPKVATFKNDILEQKQDTIGSQYAVFSRNGQTKYKEFSIAGLISCTADDENLFYNLQPQTYDERSKTASTSIKEYRNPYEVNATNLKNEREFKLDAQNWLNNGKPKLFRSATEGNYIVRIMNVSLTPNDTLGRMLHTFNATAYEMAPNTVAGLMENGFINANEPSAQIMKFETINLSDEKWDTMTDIDLAQTYSNIQYIECNDFFNNEYITINGNRIYIGGTGSYRYNGEVTSLVINTTYIRSYSTITLGYYDNGLFDIDKYDSITTGFELSRQFFGKDEDILNNTDEKNAINYTHTDTDTGITSTYTLTKLLYGLFEKRTQIECESEAEAKTNTDLSYIYYWMEESDSGEEIVAGYYDPITQTVWDKDEFNCNVTFDNEQYDADLDIYEYLEVYNLEPEDFDQIKLGPGVTALLSYNYYKVEVPND